MNRDVHFRNVDPHPLGTPLGPEPTRRSAASKYGRTIGPSTPETALSRSARGKPPQNLGGHKAGLEIRMQLVDLSRPKNANGLAKFQTNCSGYSPRQSINNSGLRVPEKHT